MRLMKPNPKEKQISFIFGNSILIDAELLLGAQSSYQMSDSDTSRTSIKGHTHVKSSKNRR